ncbi:MAG: helix-turn-helix transcriptional regulator [Clostridia bacterium]|nr:helix-turn-helix transcriptional regulator [Clostridia bacterium]
MEFNQKLQELRKNKGLTQEELAEKLFVSRTAISKWESGRGYPSIDSLKDIAKFFSVTIDELISSDETITLAKEEKRQTVSRFRDLLYGLLDLSMVLLIFLPFFAERTTEGAFPVSLLDLTSVQQYLKVLYFVTIVATALLGVTMLALQNIQAKPWTKSKIPVSLILNTTSVFLFIISLQPYAAIFAFVLLAIKATIAIIQR